MSDKRSDAGGRKRSPRAPTSSGSKKPEKRKVNMDSDDSDNGTLTNSNFDETLYQQPVETDENQIPDPDDEQFVNETNKWGSRSCPTNKEYIMNYGTFPEQPNLSQIDWPHECCRLWKCLGGWTVVAAIIVSIFVMIYYAVKYLLSLI